MYCTIGNIAIGITGLLTLALGIVCARQYWIAQHQEFEQQSKLEMAQQEALEEKRKLDSYLSTSTMLDESVIRDHLKSAYTSLWKNLATELEPLYNQSVKMDEYQRKLKSLITKNDASVLDDTEDVLIQAEQNLLHNIRKVMNYMDVCDATSEEGKAKVKESANSCYQYNQQILTTVSDFLMTLTEYLNSQGSADSLQLLSEYKEVLRGTSTKVTEVEPVVATTQLKF